MSCRKWILLTLLVGGCGEALKATAQASEPSAQPSVQQRVNFGVTIARAEFGVEPGDCNKVAAARGVQKAPISRGVRCVDFFIPKVFALKINRHVIICDHSLRNRHVTN
ncbi:MAG: hypothetical protein CMJ93_05855 [Planctomycetes bacterium]|nr:hypothetical protein [Planctomycetota bacterium]